MKKTLATLSVIGLSAGSLLVGSSGASAAEAHDDDAPGCSVSSFTANHVTGKVSWLIACDEPRIVTIDALALHGSSDEHETVSEQLTRAFVPAGGAWSGTLTFATDTTPSTDQLSAQAISLRGEDPTEQPVILGRVNG
jgi:hypothetical protein